MGDRTAAIAESAALSAALDLGGFRGQQIIGIEMPAAWTAAALTFQVSGDGTNYHDLYDDAGNELSFTVAASRMVSFTEDKRSILSRWRYIKLRSGTTGTPVNQDAARTLRVHVAAG